LKINNKTINNEVTKIIVAFKIYKNDEFFRKKFLFFLV